LLAHAEVVQSATRAGAQLVLALQQAEFFPGQSASETATIAAARAQLQAAVDAQQQIAKQQAQD
jgi:hypothetical protein